MENISQKMDDCYEFNYKIINCKIKYIRTEKIFKLFFSFVLLKFFFVATQRVCVSIMRCDVTKKEERSRRALYRTNIEH
jgi:hypothetical protein